MISDLSSHLLIKHKFMQTILALGNISSLDLHIFKSFELNVTLEMCAASIQYITPGYYISFNFRIIRPDVIFNWVMILSSHSINQFILHGLRFGTPHSYAPTLSIRCTRMKYALNSRENGESHVKQTLSTVIELYMFVVL